ncbi:unnamed protein product [Closterium sp. Naga37s-1]|nr:unnamed protein product [Closterium sp. Naga37s-1]
MYGPPTHILHLSPSPSSSYLVISVPASQPLRASSSPLTPSLSHPSSMSPVRPGLVILERFLPLCVTSFACLGRLYILLLQCQLHHISVYNRLTATAARGKVPLPPTLPPRLYHIWQASTLLISSRAFPTPGLTTTSGTNTNSNSNSTTSSSKKNKKMKSGALEMTADVLFSAQENMAAAPATLSPVAAVAASPAAPFTGTPGAPVEAQEAEARHNKRLKGQLGEGKEREGQGRGDQGGEDQGAEGQGREGRGEDGNGRDGGERGRGPFGADGPSMAALMQELGFGDFVSAPVSNDGGKEGQAGRGGGRGRGRGRGRDRGVVMGTGMVIGDRGVEGVVGAVETQGVFGSGEAWGGEGMAGWGDWDEGFGGDDGDGGREEGMGRREDGRREGGEDGETDSEGGREEIEEGEGGEGEVEVGDEEMEKGEGEMEVDGEEWGAGREEGEEGEEVEDREEGEEGEEVEDREEGEEGEEVEDGEEVVEGEEVEEGEEEEEEEREEGEEGDEREDDLLERKAGEESGPLSIGTREKKERKLAGIGAAARMVGVDDQAVNRPSVGMSGTPTNEEGLMHDGGMVLKPRPQVAAAGKLQGEKNVSGNAGGKKSTLGKVNVTVMDVTDVTVVNVNVVNVTVVNAAVVDVTVVNAAVVNVTLCDAPGTDSIPVCTEPKLGPAITGSAEPAMSQAEVHMAISTLRASAAWQLAFLPPLPQAPAASLATAGGDSVGSAAAAASSPHVSDPSFDLLLEWFLSPYRVDVTMLKRLQPDVILTQLQEEPEVLSFEDVQNVLSHVLGSEVKIVHLDPPSLVEAINDVRRIGAALGQSQRAESMAKDLMQRIQTRFSIPSPSGSGTATPAGLRAPLSCFLLTHMCFPLPSTAGWGVLSSGSCVAL